MFTSGRAKAAWLAFVLVAAAFVWTTWPLRQVASANYRLLLVFYADEAINFNHVAPGAKAHRYLSSKEIGYGFSYLNLVQTVDLLESASSDHDIIIALRTVEWAFAAGTLLIVFMAVKRASMLAAVLTTALLATLPVFVRWSWIAHPDLMQEFFIWLSLYACARRLEQGGRVWTLVAAASAGVAFGAKYAGMFLIPIVWAADVLAQPGQPYDARVVRAVRAVIVIGALAALAAGMVLSPDFVARHFTHDGSIAYPRAIQLIQLCRAAFVCAGVVGLGLAGPGAAWRRLLASPLGGVPALVLSTALAFVIAFTASSPQAWRALQFVRNLMVNVAVPRNGAAGPTPWTELIVSADLFTRGVVAFAAAGLVWLLSRVRDFRGRSAIEFVSLAWLAWFGFVTVMTLKEDRPPHYLLPLIPSIVLLAARGWEGAWMFVRRQQTAIAAIGTAALVALAAAELAYDARRALDVRHDVLAMEQDSRPVQFGLRLDCYLQPGARILYDMLSYVPPSFADATPTWGGTLEMMRDSHPDAIIVNKDIESGYRTSTGGEGDPARYYAALREHAAPYQLVATDEPVRLYVRRDSPRVVSARRCS